MIVAEQVVKDATWWTEWHLWNWRDWMYRPDLPEGVPREASGGLENYTTHDLDSERALAAHDIWAAENTNAVIEGLDGGQKIAIHHAYINAVYRFNRGNYLDLLKLGKANIMSGLRRRGVWLGE